ncbi:MAG: hypothetical protein M1838_002129 [Thelocarpon superellum]|nr:MAG: hypothetical protein M1838_002129 [Thelocarpon superellum]
MADAFNVQLFAILAAGTFVVLLRTGARLDAVGMRKLVADDYLMLLANVLFGLEIGAAYSVGALYHGLANNDMTDAERAALSPDSHEYQLRVGGSKLQLMGWSSNITLLWLLKLCLCLFYSRITTGVFHMRTRVLIGYVVIAVTYVATISSVLGGCGGTFSKNWQINPNPGNFCQPAISRVDIFVNLTLNVSTDLYLMSIPLEMLARTKISVPRKTGLLFLFSMGLFVTVASILRCYYVVNVGAIVSRGAIRATMAQSDRSLLQAGVNGAQQSGSWAVYETFAAVVVTNLPIIAPLFIKIGKKVNSKHNSNPTRSGMMASGVSRTTITAGGRMPMQRSTDSQDIILEDGVYKNQDINASEDAVQLDDLEPTREGKREEYRTGASSPTRSGINVTTRLAVKYTPKD